MVFFVRLVLLMVCWTGHSGDERKRGGVGVGCGLRWMGELLFTDFVLIMKMFVWRM